MERALLKIVFITHSNVSNNIKERSSFEHELGRKIVTPENSRALIVSAQDGLMVSNLDRCRYDANKL